MTSRACQACGREISTSSRFCRYCGAAQSSVRTPGPGDLGSYPTAAAKVEQTAPGATEFAAALATEFRSPGVVVALIAGSITFAFTVLVGFIVALATPASSIIGGFDAGLLKEAMLQACALVRAPFVGSGGDFELAGLIGVDISIQTMPVIGLAVPIGVMAFSVRRLVPRITAQPATQLAFALLAAVPFGFLMIIPAVIAEATEDGLTIEPKIGTTLGLSLLWGAIGALIGANAQVRPALDQAGRAGVTTRVFLRPPTAALRGLVIALAISAIVMSALVLIQTLRNEGNAVGDRTKAGASVENAVYIAEHGLHGVELGTLSSFDLTGLLRFAAAFSDGEQSSDFGEGLLVPLPVENVDRIVDSDTDDAKYRIFDYSDAMADYVFVPWLIVLIAIPALMALYSGFASARAAGASNRISFAAWGATAGPVWALAMVGFNAVAKGTDLLSIFGHAEGVSVLGWTFLFATALGALGGLLASLEVRSPAMKPGQ